ncbi:MAG TPA: cytidine deaminase [Firmicutes bacterium]|jgi:cytidine deaminase|nr:cytidine deaminase [Bacillota bacterium]HBR29160.1 cytidine deaminase [Bacillota bacterium]HBR34682.1 cytidine deaminase [Bacillota bacterium]
MGVIRLTEETNIYRVGEVEHRRLLAAAAEARQKAYAPYSGYQVGAALLAKSGRIYGGCNVENASYGASICAERVAAVRAIAEGETEFLAMAVIADSPEPGSPCGICRQFLVEFAPQLTLILANLEGKSRSGSLEDYLPYAFNKDYLDAEGAK